MNGVEERLRWLADAEPRMIQFLKRLIRTPSPSGGEGRIADLVAAEMEGLGYEVEVDELGSVLGRRGRRGGGRTILFDGHMDHVDPGSLESWSHGPYAAEVIDGVLYGRGSVDMKAALAAMIHGCAAPEVRGEVAVGCVVHEETCEGVATRRLIEGGLRPDACVLGEPTDLALSVGQRGRCVIRITTRGATSHASMPDLGVNALYEMIPIIDRIREAGRSLPSHLLLGAGSMAVTAIACSPGEGPIIPDRCEVLVDRRLVPSETLDGVLEELRGLAPGAQVDLVEDELAFYTGRRATAEQYFPGWIADRGHWAVDESLRALKEALGRRPGIIGWRFSTDGVATSALGIPTVGFGPGDPALAHQPDEHVALADVAAAARGYCALAHRLASA